MIISLIGEYIKNSPYDREFICEYMGVSRNTLSTWCTGKHFPSIPQLIKLADLMGIHYGDFYIVQKENEPPKEDKY